MAKKPAPGGNLQELKTQLKSKDLGRLYIFHGEEVFLLHHYLEQMKKQLLDALTESFNFHRMNSETFDLQTFADAVENLPMMAEHTMVQVDEVDLFKLGESDRNKMAEILADIPDYCTVVFTYETTPWKPDKRLKKLWEAIDGAGLIVEFAKQDQKDLAAWVTRHFMARDKRISTDLCLYLIDITGGTMTALSGEIDKICAYSGANEIRKTDIDAVTEPVLDAVVFQMTDMLSAGRFDQALVKLQQLLKMQQEPLAILGAVGNHFRRVSAARTLLDNGKNASDLQRLCGIPDYPARKTMEAARRFTPEFCRRAAELVLETDYKIKTSYDDPERLLELLLLQLARRGAMVKIREAIVVEGRYDKNTLSQVVDAPILETAGFGIFKDRQQMALLRRVAEKRGLIVFTDSDGAGFVIRNHIKSAIPGKYLKHAYIPDIPGKERRKSAPGREGKLGVEGMTPEVILAALRNAGATIEGEKTTSSGGITKQDLMALGLSGGSNAGEKRKALLKKLNLPEHMSANAMLQALNLLYTREELEQMLNESGIECD